VRRRTEAFRLALLAENALLDGDLQRALSALRHRRRRWQDGARPTASAHISCTPTEACGRARRFSGMMGDTVPRPLLLCVSIFAAVGLACGSTTLAPDGGRGAGGHAGGLPACAKSGQPGAADLPHRAQAVACPSNGWVPTADGGATTCATSSDCTADGGPGGSCINHVCTADQCLVDDDCPSGGVCVCAMGLRQLYNLCTIGTCRIDADCGAGGLCSPPYPFVVVGASYNCRSAADNCCSIADCDVGKGCEFSPTAGHWQCVTPCGTCGP
jgi:hypothetical protein